MKLNIGDNFSGSNTTRGATFVDHEASISLSKIRPHPRPIPNALAGRFRTPTNNIMFAERRGRFGGIMLQVSVLLLLVIMPIPTVSGSSSGARRRFCRSVITGFEPVRVGDLKVDGMPVRFLSTVTKRMIIKTNQEPEWLRVQDVSVYNVIWNVGDGRKWPYYSYVEGLDHSKAYRLPSPVVTFHTRNYELLEDAGNFRAVTYADVMYFHEGRWRVATYASPGIGKFWGQVVRDKNVTLICYHPTYVGDHKNLDQQTVLAPVITDQEYLQPIDLYHGERAEPVRECLSHQSAFRKLNAPRVPEDNYQQGYEIDDDVGVSWSGDNTDRCDF